VEGLDRITTLVEQAQERIRILPGGGEFLGSTFAFVDSPEGQPSGVRSTVLTRTTLVGTQVSQRESCPKS
jgi:hypothetical protein